MSTHLSWSQVLKFLQRHNVQLILLIIAALAVRLYKITNPVLDWHAFRQADTASVTYRYVKEGIDLFKPRYHDLSNIQSGQDNLQGYRMVELPIVNAATALLIQTFPQLDLVITSRLISILFSLGTILSLYWMVKMIANRQLALLTAFFMAFLPYSIYYSRVILPEPGMLFFATFSLALFISFLKTRKQLHWWLSIISLSLALLIKPFVAFWAPVYLALLFFYYAKPWLQISAYLYPILVVIPLIMWRHWITQFPQGIPASDWLLNSDGIRLRPAWFRWLFWERLGKLMSGILGVPLALLNFLKRNRILVIIFSWWIGILGYFIVIATGNVRHDYYQILALPALSLTLARGIEIGYQHLRSYLSTKIIFHQYIAQTITGVIIFLILGISWTQIKGYYNVNHWEYLKAGQAADKLLPKDALVIAPAMGDTMFLFQTRRNGWPIGYNIDEKIKLGAQYYVSTSFDKEAQELEKKYTTVKKTTEYIIIDLTNPRQD
jgi:hypothetical protein